MHISEINKLARKNNIAFKTHAILRMQERKISAKEIKDVLCNGEIIAEYKDDFPLPSCLILGKTLNKRYIHTVFSENHSIRPIIFIMSFLNNLLRTTESVPIVGRYFDKNPYVFTYSRGMQRCGI